jgi:hypothetical protein
VTWSAWRHHRSARQAAAGLDLVPDPLGRALAALENIACLRTGTTLQDAITQAETECDQAVATLVERMRLSLPSP